VSRPPCRGAFCGQDEAGAAKDAPENNLFRAASFAGRQTSLGRRGHLRDLDPDKRGTGFPAKVVLKWKWRAMCEPGRDMS
jgi:hypothetical protein